MQEQLYSMNEKYELSLYDVTRVIKLGNAVCFEQWKLIRRKIHCKNNAFTDRKPK